MASGSKTMMPIMTGAFRLAPTIVRWLVEPLVSVEEKQRRHLRLLAAFLLLTAFITLAGTLMIKQAANSFWIIVLATSGILLAGYVLSRTRYYRLATVMAVTIPALPILAMILFSPDGEHIPHHFPWLALPLLVCSLLLSLRQTIIVAVSYTVLVAALTPFIDIPAWDLFESLAFIFMIIFVVVAVTAARRHDETEIERQLYERQQVAKALQESEEKFSKAFRATPDAIAINRIADNRFIEINESFLRVSGYNRDEVLNDPSAELSLWVNESDRDRVTARFRNGEPVRNLEIEFRIKSGEKRLMLFSAEPIIIGGEPCTISIATDITERQRAEVALKQSSARLEATNKEIEAFSYSVSHDLRSPLRSIDGFSQALLEDYHDRLDEQGRDYLQRLRGASQKMGELIDGILKLSRLTRSEIHEETVDLTALAEEIARRLQESRPERRVSFAIGRGLTVKADPQLLRVLLENLIGNAWKFTGKKAMAEIEVGAVAEGERTSYYVRDNGAGFDMTYADKLFLAFQRLHDPTEFPGTGIGLATVQRIVNRLGGTIRAEGAVGRGAGFYFTLG